MALSQNSIRRSNRAPKSPDGATKRSVKDRILDEAERLFVERGYFGVSVRDITQAAETRLASVNYHFVSKENLYRDVLHRRASTITDDRLRLLDETRPQGRSVLDHVRWISQAFYMPLLTRSASGDLGWKNYCRLVAQLPGLGEWVQRLTDTLFNPVGRRFVAELANVFPKASKLELHESYQLMLASTLYVLAENGRLDLMSEGKFSSSELEKLGPLLESFVVGGVIAVCGGKA
jgi:AcrR family transcriptional regulator